MQAMALIEISMIFPARNLHKYGWDFPWQTVSHNQMDFPMDLLLATWSQGLEPLSKGQRLQRRVQLRQAMARDGKDMEVHGKHQVSMGHFFPKLNFRI